MLTLTTDGFPGFSEIDYVIMFDMGENALLLYSPEHGQLSLTGIDGFPYLYSEYFQPVLAIVANIPIENIGSSEAVNPNDFRGFLEFIIDKFDINIDIEDIVAEKIYLKDMYIDL